MADLEGAEVLTNIDEADIIADKVDSQSEDEDNEEVHSVRLVDGINLDEVQKEGATFEVMQENDVPEIRQYFDEEEFFKESYVPGFESDEDDDIDDLDDEIGEFEKKGRKMEILWQDGDAFIKKKIVTAGTGPVVPPGAHVSIHFASYKEYDDEPTDSTRMRNSMEKFQLGGGKVIYGLDKAVSSMRKNEVSRFLLSYHVAYGAIGCAPRIPPKATLLFHITLVDFTESGGAKDYYALTYEERREAPFNFVRQIAEAEQKKGSAHYKAERYEKALYSYKKAIEFMENVRLKDDAEETKQRNKLTVLYHNSAMAAIQLKRGKQALSFLHELKRFSKTAKTFYLQGKAYRILGEYQYACNSFKAAQRLEPNNRDINKALNDLAELQVQQKELEKMMCQKMLGLTNRDNNTDRTEDLSQIMNPDEVDEEFKEIIQQSLTEFIENKDVSVLPFNTHGFTLAECSLIESTAKEQGLLVDTIGQLSNRQLRISKPDTEQLE